MQWCDVSTARRGQSAYMRRPRPDCNTCKCFSWKNILLLVNLAFLAGVPILSSSSSSLSSSLSFPFSLFCRPLTMLLWWNGSRLKIRFLFMAALRFEPASPDEDAFPWNRLLAEGRNISCCCETKLWSFLFSARTSPSSSVLFLCSSALLSLFSCRT